MQVVNVYRVPVELSKFGVTKSVGTVDLHLEYKLSDFQEDLEKISGHKLDFYQEAMLVFGAIGVPLNDLGHNTVKKLYENSHAKYGESVDISKMRIRLQERVSS